MKSAKRRSHGEIKSDSDGDESSSEDSSSYSSSGSDDEGQSPVKKQKIESSSKKKSKKERRKEEKKKKLKASNKISKDDFYNKNSEFRIWLSEEKKINFEELKTTKAKAYFKKFVHKWNKRKLAKKYYKGIDAADQKTPRTTYKWKFTDQVKGSHLDSPTNSNSPFVGGQKGGRKSSFTTFGKPVTPSVLKEKPVLGPAKPPHLIHDGDLEEENLAQRLQKERKKYREQDKLVMEELAPKATGHDAKVEKRLMRAAEKRTRELSPEMADRQLMGYSDTQRYISKKQQERGRNQELLRNKANAKLEEYQAKEKAKMQALLEVAKASKRDNALW